MRQPLRPHGPKPTADRGKLAEAGSQKVDQGAVMACCNSMARGWGGRTCRKEDSSPHPSPSTCSDGVWGEEADQVSPHHCVPEQKKLCSQETSEGEGPDWAVDPLVIQARTDA
ncbi:hypothetical protein NDU88_005790 [Pleurodeles waltl]|uniref:Uncharacterized protein n=1 Tax=Pleurodeles waltl TaxID=8319 RepID=A0AAV7LQ25_PLEWA|nr:hypothetical protein NDU88_005790 [Pleurodeles waltl]